MRVLSGIILILGLMFGLVFRTELKAQDFDIVDYTSKQKKNLKYNNEEIALLRAVEFPDFADIQTSEYQMVIPQNDGSKWILDLTHESIISPGFSVRLLLADGSQTTEEVEIKAYSGSIRGEANSAVRMVISENFISGSVQKGKDVFNLSKAEYLNKSFASNDYIFYKSDLIDNEARLCGQELYNLNSSQLETTEKYTTQDALKSACKKMEMAIAVDFSIYNKYGSIQDAVSHIVSILNLSEANFNGPFNDNIDFEIVEIAVSTCIDCDPWTSESNALGLLNSFNQWGEAGAFKNQYDVAELWTDRSFESGIIALAYQGEICNGGRYHILSDYTNNIQGLRSMASHEIGHNYNGFHNYEFGDACSGNVTRDPLIMDPTIFPNSVSWSNGTQNCALNTVNSINSRLSSISCLGSCTPIPCDKIENLTLTNISQNSLNANWDGNASNYRVRIREEGASSDMVNIMVNNSNYNHSGPSFELCNNYKIIVEEECSPNVYSAVESAIFGTPYDTKFTILDARPSNCQGVSSKTYTLEVILEHRGGGSSNQFRINVNGSPYFFNYGSSNSPQSVMIENLPADGQEGIQIQARDVSNNGIYCDDSFYFDAPNGNCDFKYTYKFDNCKFPYEWNISSTNNTLFSVPYDWKVDDGDRVFQNYDDFVNTGTSKTINGTCMAYMDDDVSPSLQYTGTVYMTSRTFDLSVFMDASLEFDYNFHNFADGKSQQNNSAFSVEVFNGSNWVEIFEDSDDVCDWWNVWIDPCIDHVSLNLQSYLNSDLQVRFIYTDGNDGKWTGMIALDDIRITAIGGNSTVALELLEFDARLNADNEVNLSWGVSDENNLASYIIEHSENGKAFQLLKEVPVTNSNRYVYVDHNPGVGSNFYRLSSIDHQGNSRFLGIEEVSLSENEDLKIYPTLINQQKFYIEKSQEFELNSLILYDANGRIVRDWRIQHDSNKQKLEFSLPNLNSGVYYIQIFSKSTRVQTKKIVILN
jgi:hypothetical protein